MAQENQKDTRARARLEAQPLRWLEGKGDAESVRDERTEEQKNAMQRVHEIFLDIANQPFCAAGPPSGVDFYLPRIDPKRLNHAVLLDGKRGSGKTALMLTLLDAWSRDTRYRLGGVPSKLCEGVFKPVADLEARLIVPVGLIDLQPLPESTSLIMHLAGQLYRVVEGLEPDSSRSGGGRESAAWHAGAEEEILKSKAAWNRFLRAAAAGWDGNRLQRATNLDPESYAVEFEQTERQRLDVVSSFRAFMDALVSDYEGLRAPQNLKPPLFVISVDDGDMNVSRVVELLDLVRTLWHPRVVFLLTGDSELFQAALDVAEVGRLMAPVRGIGLLQSTIEKPQETALKVATDIYNKAIPKGHRIRLHVPSLHERMELLRDVLATLPAPDRIPQLENMYAYFRAREQAQLLLPSRLRDLIDLKQAFSGLPHKLGTARSPHDETTQKTLQILLGFDLSPTDREARSLAEKGIGAYVQLAPPGLPKWDDFPGKQAFLFPPGASQQIRIKRPLLLFENQDRITSAKILIARDYDPAYPSIENTSFHTSELVSGIVHVLPDRISWVLEWPVPHAPSSLAFDIYALKWCAAFDAYQSTLGGKTVQQDEMASEVARLYLHLMLSSASSPKLSDIEQYRNPGERFRSTIPSWKELAAQIAELAVNNKSPDDTDIRSRWIAAALLAAPEYGLPATVANDWLSVWKTEFEKRGIWPQIQSRMAIRRRHQLAKLLKKHAALDSDAEQNAVERRRKLIDRKRPEHRWQMEVEPEAQKSTKALPAPEEPAEKLIKVLKSIQKIAQRLLPSQERILRRADPHLIQTWLSHVSRFERTRDAHKIVIHALWKCAVEEGFAPELGNVPNSITKGFLNQVFDDLEKKLNKEPWQFHVVPSSEMPVGTSVKAQQASFRWLKETGFQDTLASALYELAYDVMDETEDQKQPPHAAWIRWWLAGGGQFNGQLFPWPTLEWPLYCEAHQAATAWNNLLEQAAKDYALRPSPYQTADSLAYAFIRMQIDVFHNNVLDEWRPDIDPRNWSVLTANTHFNPEPRFWRQNAFKTFVEHIPLLAAPESGLSREASDAILDGSLNLPKNLLPQALRALRVQRCKDNGISVSILKKIDEAHPDHPWVTRIEKALKSP